MLKAAAYFDIVLQAVRITEVKERTFYARIIASSSVGSIDMDARPSDAVNLAVRSGTAMQVIRSVTRQAAADFGKTPRAFRTVWGGATSEQLDDLRGRAAANLGDLSLRLDLGTKLAQIQITRAFIRPWPLPAERMVQQATEYLAEARTHLGEVLQQSHDPQQRRDAAMWLGSVEYLEGRFAEAVAAFEQYDGAWADLDWSASLHFATALHRVGRSEEVLTRLADAAAAIDRMHGTAPMAGGRLLARERLANVIASTMPDLLSRPELRRIFELYDPACLMVSPRAKSPFDAGSVYPLEDRGLIIGSAAEVDVQVPDEKVGGRHARVYRDADGWKVEDLGSAEGTYVKNQRISQPTKIDSCDVIHLGTQLGHSRILLLDMSQWLTMREPGPAEPATFVYLVDGKPFGFSVPLEQRFRKKEKPLPPVIKTFADGAAPRADASLPISHSPPSFPGCLALWQAQQLHCDMSGELTRLAISGQEGQDVVLEGPSSRYNTASTLIAGAPMPLRPMTEQLAATFLAAGQVTCDCILLTPPDETKQRTARVYLRCDDREIWLDADPIDAITMAAAMKPSPPVWVCNAE